MLKWTQAVVIVLAFGLTLVGKVLMYPCHQAGGTLLERIRAEEAAWDLSHRVFLVGLLITPWAAAAIWRAMVARTPTLATLGAAMMALSAASGVGQFALDFAFMIAARMEDQVSAQAFVEGMLALPFTKLLFYDAIGYLGLGVPILAVAMWFHGGAWRVPALILFAILLVPVVKPWAGPFRSFLEPSMQFIGFSLVAWRITSMDTVSAVTAR